MFRFASISETVFTPSAKSCAITAKATARPTLAPVWKPIPIAIPSVRLCPASAIAEATPTAGRWW